MESSSSLSKTPSFRRSTSKKIDYLYEVEYVSDDSKVPITQLPLLNPYKAFTKPNSTFPKDIRQVFVPNKHNAKELVLASPLEQHLIPATETEQMIPLRINEGMIHHWRTQGYTHLHYGAIRLALTLHGRKGLPVVARVALLDTRYKEYQHACIATIQTTLNAGTVFVTLFPNFNVALEDPQIYQNMQIQLQITGAPQIGNTYAATLHHQMAYRVQNHAMDLSLPRDTEDALLIQLESQHSPSCIHIPRQIPRDELVKLLPESWVTNYEKLHDRSTPIQSVDSSIHRRKDGAVEIAFKQQEEKSRPTAFCTEINTITPFEDTQTLEINPRLDGVPISSFDSLGDPIYSFQDETGHKFFDVCDCQHCQMNSSDDDDTPRRRRKKKTTQQILKERFESGDPQVGLLGEPSGKNFEYYVLYSGGSTPTTPEKEEVQLSYMFGPPSQQDSPFPSKEFEESNIKHSWKIRNPNVKNPDGSVKQISAAEATLNWQSENAVTQNHLLSQIDKKVTIMDLSIKELTKKIISLHQELLHLATTVSMNSPLMFQKESELKSLKAQLHSLQNQPKTQPPTPYDLFTPYPIYTPPYTAQTQPLSFSQDPSIFGASSFLPTKVLYEQQSTKKKKPTEKRLGKEAILEPPKPITETSKSQDQPEASKMQFMVEHANPITVFLEKVAKQEKRLSQGSMMNKVPTTLKDENDEAMIPHFMMASPTVVEEDIESEGGNVYEETQELDKIRQKETRGLVQNHIRVSLLMMFPLQNGVTKYMRCMHG
ncbi:PREDICTED: uncharacterized protein LOC104724406 [Camelina sativa]|uniref:Uncharacterized protein LOC104724406 n=1 Tax=Camelina sativa TaxID=90675 RepID=A0ABM1QL78_CAMSA|nr:PREDICTED: uncharacterized protein LOC104724406 [Camelina sativa]